MYYIPDVSMVRSVVPYSEKLVRTYIVVLLNPLLETSCIGLSLPNATSVREHVLIFPFGRWAW